MKTKAKLVLGLSILTAATLTAGATGTFAWFTTNRKATATFNHIMAKSVEGSLTIAMGSLTETSLGENGADYKSTTATLTGSNSAMTDVSSADGVNFAHPNWTDKAGNDQKVHGITDVSGKTADNLTKYGSKGGYWTAYYIGLKNNGGKPANVYLNAGSTISGASTEAGAQKTKDDSAANWTRVAINAAGETKPSTTLATVASTKIIQNATEATAKKYVKADDSADSINLVDLPASSQLFDGSTANSLKEVTIADDPTTIQNQLVCTIPADGAIRYLTVSVWLEGTMSDNQDAAIGGVVNVVLNFAARTAE